MIRLERPTCPAELTPSVQAALTAEFKSSNASVWNQRYIKDTLMAMSRQKCCFCECKLGEESKYIEVEHFHHKALYPDEVVTWTNLLPACRRCNGAKGQHDTKVSPIIDPTQEDPRDHLGLRNYRLRSKGQLGQTTIDVLDLNDTERLVFPRLELAEAMQNSLERLLELASEYSNGTATSTKRKNQVYRGTRSLLLEASPQSEYSSVMATVLLNEENYQALRQLLVDTGLWDQDLTDLEHQASDIALGYC